MIKKHIITSILLLALSLSSWAQGDFPAKPNPPRLVNDFSKTLSDNEVRQLESKLVAYNDSTSSQVSIVLINSIGPYDISDYAFQLGENWGIGLNIIHFFVFYILLKQLKIVNNQEIGISNK